MKISNFLRKTLMFILNVLKFLSLILGTLGFMVFICGVDSDGAAGDWFMSGVFISMLLIISSILNEIFVVKVLLRRTERLRCLFNFDFYPENALPREESDDK